MVVKVVGLIGAGGISRPHLAAWKLLSETADLRVVVYSPEGSHDMVQEAGFGDVCATLEELLEASDLVDVVAPSYVHAEIVEAALDAGVDVVCEKPLALTSVQAARLVDKAQALGRHLFPAHVVRYFPQYLEAKRALDSGMLGELAVARFERVGSFPRWAPWFADEELSGGVVMDLMIHDLDACRWLAGEVEQVYASVVQDRTAPGHPQSLCQAVLTHRSGAISLLTAVWGAPGLTFNTSFHLSGSAGQAHYASAQHHAVSFDLGTANSMHSPARPIDLTTIESPYLSELRDFLSAICVPRENGSVANDLGDQRGPVPRVDASDGVTAVRLAEAVMTSAALGTPVDFSRYPATKEGD